jgi:predicted ester cyclase
MLPYRRTRLIMSCRTTAPLQPAVSKTGRKFMNILSRISDVICCETSEIGNLEHNKAIVRRYLDEIVNRRNLAAFDDFFAEDVVFNDVRNFTTDLPAFMLAIQSAFPDCRLTIGDQIAEGDKVVTRVTFYGTREGLLTCSGATAKPMEWAGIAIDRIANGKIVEMWHVQNPPVAATDGHGASAT